MHLTLSLSISYPYLIKFQFCDVAEVPIISKVATCANMEAGKNQNLSVFLATYWN
jgi:hypothetical protein